MWVTATLAVCQLHLFLSPSVGGNRNGIAADVLQLFLSMSWFCIPIDMLESQATDHGETIQQIDSAAQKSISPYGMGASEA